MKYLAKQSILVAYISIATFSTLSVSAADQDAVQRGLSSTVTMSYNYNNNVLSDANSTVNSSILIIAPQLKLLAGSGASTYELALNVLVGKYEESSEDNYTDIGLSGLANYDLGARHKLFLSGALNSGHDNRGTNFSQGNGASRTEVEEYTDTNASVIYVYGSQASAGQLDFSLDARDVDYDKRLDDQGFDTTSNRDRFSLSAKLGFTYVMTPNTNFVASLDVTDIDYYVNSGLDSIEDAVLFGITLNPTSKLSGSLKVGYRTRELENNTDSSSSTWQMNLNWAFLNYSNFVFTAGKANSESIGIGTFREVTQAGVSWNHQWGDRISSIVAFRSTHTVYQNASLSDDQTSVNFSLKYQFRPKIALRFTYINAERDSTRPLSASDFESEIIGLSLVYTIR